MPTIQGFSKVDSSQTKVDVGKNFEMKCEADNKIIGDSLDPLKLLCKDGKIADLVWPLTHFFSKSENLT